MKVKSKKAYSEKQQEASWRKNRESKNGKSEKEHTWRARKRGKLEVAKFPPTYGTGSISIREPSG